jgi:hypothetical protein
MIQFWVYFSIYLMTLPMAELLLPSYSQITSEEAKLEFRFRFGEDTLFLHQKYMLSDSSALIFTKIQFYLAKPYLHQSTQNIIKATKAYYFVPLAEGESKTQISMGKVSKNQDYTHVTFGIGVDSLQNHHGTQKDALDPLNGMFWTWSQGYVFFKIEGYYFTKEGERGGFIYHIGGDNCYRTTTLELDTPVQQDKNTLLYPINIQLECLFGLYPNPSILLEIPKDKQKISVMGGLQASQIADNFKKGFCKSVK